MRDPSCLHGPSMCVAVAFVVAFGATVSCAEDPASRPVADANDIRRAVIEAAAACGWVKWPQDRFPATAPADDPYLRAAARATRGGRDSLSALEELGRDKELSPFQRRVAMIIAERVRAPGPFEEVEGILRNPLRMRPIEPSLPAEMSLWQGPGWDYIPRAMPPRMMTASDRALMEKYQDYMTADEALRCEVGIWARVGTPVPEHPGPVSEQEWRVYHERHEQLLTKYRVDRRMVMKLLGPHHVAPEYLPAWEEAAVRPIPPQWKLWFAGAVAASADAASAPTFGEMYRQVIPFPYGFIVGSPVSPAIRQSAAATAAEGLARMPSRVGLLEVSEILREEEKLEREYHRAFTELIKWRLAKLPKWLALLEEMKGDKDMAEHVDRVWAVIKPYVEYYRRQEAEKAAKQPATAASQPKPDAGT